MDLWSEARLRPARMRPPTKRPRVSLCCVYTVTRAADNSSKELVQQSYYLATFDLLDPSALLAHGCPCSDGRPTSLR
jgi:hypothetical protein